MIKSVSTDWLSRGVLFTVFATICFQLFLPNGARAQEQRRFLHWSYRDGASILKDIAPLTPIYAIAGGGLLFTGLQIDEPLLTDVQKGYNGAWGTYLDITNEIGNPLFGVPVAGTFGVSLLTKNERFQDAAFTSLQSWLYAGLLTQVLKNAIGRFRPVDGGDAGHFEPFSGNTSFPSGHVTAAFAIITPWVLYYPHPLTYGLFALSTGTAIARIALDRHWPTDTIAGAAIGFFVGRSLVKKHQGNVVNKKVTVSSTIAPNAFLLNLRW